MAQWNKNPSWTPFEQINGGNRFERRLSAEDLNALAENIAYLKSIGVTGDATATEDTVVNGRTYYANNKRYTGSMPPLSSANTDQLYLKHVSVQGAPNGYLDLYARTYNYHYVPPTVFEGDPVGAGDRVASLVEPNLVAYNIKKGVNIFGLVGSYEGSTIVDAGTCTMEYVSGSDPLGIVYSDGTESKTWANTPTGERITVACNTPITFYYPMSDDEPNVTLTTENGVTIQPFFSLNYKTIYSIPREYKNKHITITW